MFSCKFCKTSKNTVFTERLWATASDYRVFSVSFKRSSTTILVFLWLTLSMFLPTRFINFSNVLHEHFIKKSRRSQPEVFCKKMSCKISLPQKNTSNGVMYLIIVKGLGLQHYKKLFHLRLFFLLSFEKLFRTVIL